MKLKSSVCKFCKKIAKKLYLKGAKCHSPKCPVEVNFTKKLKKGIYTPESRESDRKISRFGLEMGEKRKLLLHYDLTNTTLFRIFVLSDRNTGLTSENIFRNLEMLLESVLVRSGLCLAFGEACQLISHGFVKVNGKRVDIRTFITNKDDIITFDRKLRMQGSPARWLEVTEDREGNVDKIQVMSFPLRMDYPITVDFQRVVDFYQRRY